MSLFPRFSHGFSSIQHQKLLRPQHVWVTRTFNAIIFPIRNHSAVMSSIWTVPNPKFSTGFRIRYEFRPIFASKCPSAQWETPNEFIWVSEFGCIGFFNLQSGVQKHTKMIPSIWSESPKSRFFAMIGKQNDPSFYREMTVLNCCRVSVIGRFWVAFVFITE